MTYFFRSLLILTLTSCAFHVDTPVKEVHSTEGGIVVTEHPLATQAGIEILKKGGNAIDAALATFYTLAVAYPRAGNLAGGGFALIRSPQGEHYALDFREKAPFQSTTDMYLDEQGEPVEGASRYGGLSVGVPGSVAGMEALHNRWGQLPFSDCLKPAIKIARRGFHLTHGEASRLNHYRDEILSWNSEEIPFLNPEGFQQGDILKQPALFNTIKHIAENGSASFYQSPISSSMVQRIQETGGIIEQKDFDRYEAIWRDPIAFPYKSYTIYSMPPPSSGGIVLGQILTSMSSHSFNHPGSLDDMHRMIEAERRAFADRATFLGDSDFSDVPVDSLLDPEYINSRMADFNPEEASPSEAISAGSFDWSRESFETTHLCVAADGWVVSITTTLNGNYGSKVFVPDLGIFLNNEMDDFSIKPGVPNQFGLLGSEANSIEPEKRMLSSMTPTIIDKNGEFFMTLGTPGGSTIITSVAQVFLNVAEYNMSLHDAIRRPRFHHQWWPDIVMYEEDMPDQTVQALHDIGHQTKPLRLIGLVEAIMQVEDGKLIGVADMRGEDHAASMD